MAIFSVQAQPTDATSWLDLARRVEAAGFDALLAADHPGHGASPFVSLAAAAELAADTGLAVAELLATPFVLIGTEEEIVTAVAAHQRRWGITRFVVRKDAVDPLRALLPRLAALE